jgi:hypothetical protein
VIRVRRRGAPLAEPTLTIFVTLDGVAQAPGGPNERTYESHTAGAGAVLGIYRRAGNLKTGSFPLD